MTLNDIHIIVDGSFFLIIFRIRRFQHEIKGNQLLLAINENNYLFINICCLIYVVLLKCFFFLSFKG